MSSLQIMQAFKRSFTNSNTIRTMQRQRNTMGRRPQQRQQQRQRTPFCSFCKHAGKSHAEYTSHYPKDRPGPEGKVICPTILASECSYCHEKGHTKRHCPKLRRRNQARNGVVRARVVKREAPQPRNSLFGYINQATKGGEGWTTVRSKVELKVTDKKAPKRRHNLANAFNTIADSDDEDEVKQSLAPAVVKVVKPVGVWGKPLATNVVKDEEMSNPFASSMEEIVDKERLAAEKEEQEKENELRQIMRDDEWEAYTQYKYEQEVEAERDYDDDYLNEVDDEQQYYNDYDNDYDNNYNTEYDRERRFPQTDNSAW